jgi:hypothetical protein
MEEILPSETNSSAASQEIPVFYGAKMSITVSKTASHQPPSTEPIVKRPQSLVLLLEDIYFNVIIPF